MPSWVTAGTWVTGSDEPEFTVGAKRLGSTSSVMGGRSVVHAASGIGPGNAVARDIRLAEMLIGKSAQPIPEALGSPAVKLKSLLAA